MDNRSSNTVARVAGWLVPIVCTALLLWYMFSKVDFAQMMHILRGGVDYWWILAAMGISVFSHIFRAARWRLQLRALGITAPFQALCCSIFGCYALNLVFPRLGEVWRCTYISRRQKAPFSTVLGSLVADRLSDTLTVLCLTLLTFIVAAPALTAFLTKYPVGRDLLHTLSSAWTWAAIAGGTAAVALILYLMRRSALMLKARRMLGRLWEGFAVVARMKGRGLFLLLTLCIWGCYYIQLYVAFYAFPFTRALCTPELAWGLVPCLVAFVLSSIGMAVPSNGGLGPWNVAVMFGLALYGVTDAQGSAFSILQWSGQTVMLVILGLYTMGYIALGRKTSKPCKTATES
ncbi:MAG: flippase-like domain-containing protein [Muribaculaceae bacterium]|nr:flippase-like domain-containing protein [Muribaculaceae bacterium]